jgi:hypothetical protein
MARFLLTDDLRKTAQSLARIIGVDLYESLWVWLRRLEHR